jgi:hypothetical protein
VCPKSPTPLVGTHTPRANAQLFHTHRHNKQPRVPARENERRNVQKCYLHNRHKRPAARPAAPGLASGVPPASSPNRPTPGKPSTDRSKIGQADVHLTGRSAPWPASLGNDAPARQGWPSGPPATPATALTGLHPHQKPAHPATAASVQTPPRSRYRTHNPEATG